VGRGFESPMAGIGTTSLAGLRMGKRFISFPAVAVSLMFFGIRFDPSKGKAIGDPFRVTSFESPALMVPKYIYPVELSLTQDKLVLTMEKRSGSIWVLDNVDR
jgi:hypothetical protein